MLCGTIYLHVKKRDDTTEWSSRVLATEVTAQITLILLLCKLTRVYVDYAVAHLIISRVITLLCVFYLISQDDESFQDDDQKHLLYDVFAVGIAAFLMFSIDWRINLWVGFPLLTIGNYLTSMRALTDEGQNMAGFKSPESFLV